MMPEAWSGKEQDHAPAEARIEDLARLRAEFDRSFSLPPRPVEVAMREFCLVEAGSTTIALETAGLRGIQKATRVIPVVSRRPEVLGIAGVGSRLASVYSLARLLEPDAEISPTSPAFFALMEHDGETVAFTFDRLHRYARVTAEDCFAGAAGAVAGAAGAFAGPGGTGEGTLTVRVGETLFRAVEPRRLLGRILKAMEGGMETREDQVR